MRAHASSAAISVLQFAVDGAQVALEHVDLDLVLLFEQGFAELSAAVERGRALAHQRVPGRLQILEPALRFGRHLGPARLQRGGQLGQFPSVYGVGLGAAPGRLGEAPRLPGVHLRQRQLRFGQRFLEVPVVGAGGLVRDALDRSSDPIDQRPEAGRVIVELGGMAVGQPVRVQVRFRDVDAYGMLFHLSGLLCLSFGP